MIIFITWGVILLLAAIGFLACRKLREIPKPFQSMTEAVYEFIEGICLNSLGPVEGPKFIPFILSLFLFILISNWIIVLPNIIGFFGLLIALIYKAFGSSLVTISFESLFHIQVHIRDALWVSKVAGFEKLEEPTKILNTDLAFALVVFLTAQIYGIRRHGFLGYAKHYMGIIPAKPPYTWFFFLNPFFYLEVISKLSAVVSHSFRLYGNIFGGAMIVTLVSGLVANFLVPVGLYVFFGLFEGIIQAFVFTMLAVTYISQEA